MTEPPEKLPLEEVKKLSAQAFEENIDLMRALAEYDMRESNLPENSNMKTVTTFTSGDKSNSNEQLWIEAAAEARKIYEVEHESDELNQHIKKFITSSLHQGY